MFHLSSDHQRRRPRQQNQAPPLPGVYPRRRQGPPPIRAGPTVRAKQHQVEPNQALYRPTSTSSRQAQTKRQLHAPTQNYIPHATRQIYIPHAPTQNYISLLPHRTTFPILPHRTTFPILPDRATFPCSHTELHSPYSQTELHFPAPTQNYISDIKRPAWLQYKDNTSHSGRSLFCFSSRTSTSLNSVL